MGGCGPNCKCGGKDEEARLSTMAEAYEPLEEERTFLPEMSIDAFTAEQPEGWHPCLKQKTRCVIKVLNLGVTVTIQEFTAYNSCHVEDAEVCPRVTAGSPSGEGYDLCGPPNHAEQEAAKLLLKTYPNGAPEGSTAFLYGHTWLCMDCQHALTAAGVQHFVVTGEPA